VLAYPPQPFNYSKVHNRAIRQADGTIICLLNDDVTVVTPDWLEKLVSRVQLDGVAAAGALLLYPDNTIQHAGVIVGLGVANHPFRTFPKGSTGYFGRAMLEQDLSCVTAACMAVRRDVFDAVGGFNEELPIAFNDVDLCLRIREAGWRIIWTPSVEMIHHESVSVGRGDSPERRAGFHAETEKMQALWGERLKRDPFYNPNLAQNATSFALAVPPRIDRP
jgi:GT2 family glycosyltransferase